MSILPRKNKELQISYSIDKINEVAEEIRQLLVVKETEARLTILEAYHDVGTIILKEFPNNTSKVVQRIAEKIGRSERTIQYAVAFAKKYPDMNRLPEGNNVSWSKVVHKYLTKPNTDPCEHEFIEICKKCGFRKI